MRMEKKWFIDELARRTVEALKKNGFDALYASNKEEALDKILQLIPKKSTVGIPGSVTLREIGIVESLIEKGYDVAENWLKKYSPEEDLEIRKKHLSSDVLLTSSNAVTEDGIMTSFGDDHLEDATMELYTSKSAVSKIIHADDQSKAAREALNNKEITYKGIGIGKKIKLFFVGIAAKIASWFM